MKKSNMIILSIIIVLAILGGIGFWKWESGKKTNISKENIDQKQEPQEETTSKESVSEENLVWYEIPELGIRFKVQKELAGKLSYTYKDIRDEKTGKNHQVIYISCGALSKYSKNDVSLDDPMIKGRPYRELRDSYFVYSSSQVPCEETEGIDIKAVLDILEI